MPPEVAHWLLRSITYGAATVVAGLFAVSKLCEAFESVANVLGPPGRWLRRRAQRRIRSALKVQDDYKALLRRISDLEKMVRTVERESRERVRIVERDSRERERKLESKIKKLELVEEVNAAHQDMTAEYLRLDAQWHIDAGTLAIEDKYQLLPHLSYSKFCNEYREKHGMGYGRRWSDDPKR